MTNKKSLYVIIIILVVIVVGVLVFFLSNKGEQKGIQTETPITNSPSTATETPVVDNTMVDCGEAKDPQCFMNRMSGCLPVTVKMVGSDNKTAIQMTILGVEDEKCHFERKINDVVDMNCFFPKGTMNWDTIDQTFGNDRGLQKVVDDACKKGW